jgi:hypothetical protein
MLPLLTPMRVVSYPSFQQRFCERRCPHLRSHVLMPLRANMHVSNVGALFPLALLTARRLTETGSGLVVQKPK